MKRALSVLLLTALLFTLYGCGSEETVAAEGLTYTCPMHPDVKQDEPGQCPICGMDLVPQAPAARTTYTCPMHPQVKQDEPGQCPICGMDLVPQESNGSATEIYLDSAQLRLGNIRTDTIGQASIGETVVLYGRLAADQERVSLITSRIAGRIERLYVKATGVPVRKGAPLYDLYSEQLLTLQQEYLLALEEDELLGADRAPAAKRKLLLYGMNEGQVERLATTHQVAPATTIPSPAGGIVTEVLAAEGQYVAEGGLLFRVDDLSRLWVEAEVYPNELTLVRAGQRVRVEVTGFGDEPVPATISFISPEYRAGSRVVLVRASIPNPGYRFVPGMQANILLPRHQREALALPVGAVIREEEGSHVWVRNPNGAFVMRPVSTGEENFERVEILDGLEAGEEVVVSGAYALYGEWKLKYGGRAMAAVTHQHEDGDAMPDPGQVHGDGGPNYTSAYICPMHCEGSGDDEPGRCPVCGMYYVPQAEHTADGHTH